MRRTGVKALGIGALAVVAALTGCAQQAGSATAPDTGVEIAGPELLADTSDQVFGTVEQRQAGQEKQFYLLQSATSACAAGKRPAPGRFRDHFHTAHGHDRLAAVVQREVIAWRTYLTTARDDGGLGSAPVTVNTHLASLSGFTTWVCTHDPAALPPCRPATRAPRSVTCPCPRSNPAH